MEPSKSRRKGAALPQHRADVAIVGAGILGLAAAYTAAKRGRRVVVFERSPVAAGASVRNFGMIWPIGQAAGRMHQMALRSREIWLEVLEAAKLPYFATGSLHAAYREDEAAVGEEFASIAGAHGYQAEWISASAALAKSSSLRSEGLLGALWSPIEMVVGPRLTLAVLPRYLTETLGVQFHFQTAVREVRRPFVYTGSGAVWHADEIVVCSGHDFETLFPDVFAASGLTRCKLQMLRTAPQPSGWALGPSLAGGLTMRYYPAFALCSSLGRLKERVSAELSEYDRYGIHVLVSQTASSEVTLGDSHEYGLDVDIFDKAVIDELILRYLDGFVQLPNRAIAERWHGVYARHPELPYCVFHPAAGERVVTGMGGSGMTLSFALAESLWAQ